MSLDGIWLTVEPTWAIGVKGGSGSGSEEKEDGRRMAPYSPHLRMQSSGSCVGKTRCRVHPEMMADGASKE